MAAVHYVRFAVPAATLALFESGASARLVVDHPNYQAETALAVEVLAELKNDLQTA